MKGRHAALIVAATVVVGVLVAVVILMVRGGSEPSPEPDPTQKPLASGTATPEPEGEETTGEGEDADARAAEDVAAHFVVAYFSQSYRDDTPNTWITAIEPYTTPDLYAELTDGADPQDSGSMWPEYITERMTDSVSVTSVDSRMDGDHRTVLVQYKLRTSTRSGSYSSTEAITVRTVPHDGTWLVDEVSADPDDYAGFFDHADHDH